MKYEAVIGDYSFIMTSPDVIEVWGQDNENPETYIFLKEGTITNEKSFQKEISWWVMDNSR